MSEKMMSFEHKCFCLINIFFLILHPNAVTAGCKRATSMQKPFPGCRCLNSTLERTELDLNSNLSTFYSKYLLWAMRMFPRPSCSLSLAVTNVARWPGSTYDPRIVRKSGLLDNYGPRYFWKWRQLSSGWKWLSMQKMTSHFLFTT